MKNIKLEINMELVQPEELSKADRDLVEKAIMATKNSYARYSHFFVGAAVRLANGETVIGANQENAAFPSGLCAERTAVFAAQASHPDQPITTLAIAARNEKGLTTNPVSPCGACRQVILEVEDRYKSPVRILLYGTKGIYILHSIKDLLPLSFVDADMH
jgi:cytidine deaminase